MPSGKDSMYNPIGKLRVFHAVTGSITSFVSFAGELTRLEIGYASISLGYQRVLSVNIR